MSGSDKARGYRTDDEPQNNLLRALRPADYELLKPHLTQWTGAANHLLYNPGDNVEVIYFPCGPSLASFLVPSEEGRDVETVLIGREGAVGRHCQPWPSARVHARHRTVRGAFPAPEGIGA